MAKQNGKAAHRHEWIQCRVALEQKGGRVTGITVTWQCAVRKCAAQTYSSAAIRKPSATATPKGDTWTEGLARRDGKAAARKLRETQGAAVDLETAPDLDDLAAEFEPTGNVGGRAGTPTREETADWMKFLAPDKPAEIFAGRV